MPPSINNKRYMIVFIDIFTRMVWPFFVKNRDESARCLKEFHQMAERQSDYGKLLAIRSDNAKEFTDGAFQTY
ncbi:integrase catalytic domain-containing protein, partial [Staphylococcus aureus]|uniref:integrase catalytic domain-containing protein n=1 Tax=Staphylococcus aureus TaxID=1280 RepID=UPI003D0EE747